MLRGGFFLMYRHPHKNILTWNLLQSHGICLQSIILKINETIHIHMIENPYVGAVSMYSPLSLRQSLQAHSKCEGAYVLMQVTTLGSAIFKRTWQAVYLVLGNYLVKKIIFSFCVIKKKSIKITDQFVSWCCAYEMVDKKIICI